MVWEVLINHNEIQGQNVGQQWISEYPRLEQVIPRYFSNQPLFI